MRTGGGLQAGRPPCALLATRDRRLLFIEPADPSDPLDLLPLHRTLAWTHLDEVRLVSILPLDRRHNAKIDYPALREMAVHR